MKTGVALWPLDATLEWSELGRRLAAADREKFEEVLDLVRIVVETQDEINFAQEAN